ncbi:adenylyltransferase/cytidyltransferase family protein [Haladaptatus sp. DFWS20]|uniref:adenylyltransferase/cytidyltransferase family protein n=1 Tax=Haladaptatus sp. DFWS20 TaxID=3403467 RepID=UPI003EBDA589
MTHVLAQGTFDILHPGHVHYLRDSAEMGDRLSVIIARRENVTHKQKPILPNQQRREMISALEMVDHARVGHPEDIFVPIEELDPDIIALGYDQHHDDAAIEAELRRRGIDCVVRRASPLDPEAAEELLSTGRIIDRICKERCD